MPQILNRYTTLDRPNYNLPLGPLAMRGLGAYIPNRTSQMDRSFFPLSGRFATMNSFSTGPAPIVYPLQGRRRRLGMGPPSQLYGRNYYHREPIRLGYLGDNGEVISVATTTTPTPTTGAQTNTSIFTTDEVFPEKSFWGGTTGRVTLVAGGFVAGYLMRCLIKKKG